MSSSSAVPEADVAVLDEAVLWTEFVAAHEDAYGYGRDGDGEESFLVDRIRAEELAHLPPNEVYLDAAGSAVPPASVLDEAFATLRGAAFGNPHSANPSSVRTTAKIRAARDRVAAFFGTTTDEYAVVFTANASAGLRIVADAFAWEDGSSVLAHTLQCHTSVLGMRAVAIDRGASLRVLEPPEVDEYLDQALGGPASGPSLFVWPGECNFAGTKYPLEWGSRIVAAAEDGQDGGGDDDDDEGKPCARWYSLLDASKLASAAAVDLSATPADFVVCSVYKIIGYPSGVGILLIRRAAASVLSSRRFFGGGTVAATASSQLFHALAPTLHERFEDGTLAFLDIATLPIGLDWIDQTLGGMDRIGAHTCALAAFVRSVLGGLRHHNGLPVVVIHADHAFPVGPVVNFSVLDAAGEPVGYAEVGRLASLAGFHVRTGRFCNAGACEAFLGITPDLVRANYAAGHVCRNTADVVDGRATGSVRVSVPYFATFHECFSFCAFVARNFAEVSAMKGSTTHADAVVAAAEALGGGGTYTEARVDLLVLYPIKSCGGFRVDEWELSDRGFLYDRHWVVVSEGRGLSQKDEPRLALIRPSISMLRQTLTVTAPGMPNLVVPLHGDKLEDTGAISICGDVCEASAYGADKNAWFSDFLGRPCSLVTRAKNRVALGSSKGATSTLGFANESQFLLVNTASVDAVSEAVVANPRSPARSPVPPSRFRANIVVTTAADAPFVEDAVDRIRIGSQVFRVVGPCARCRMVCVDQATGERSAEPLFTMTKTRRYDGRILFGQHLAHDRGLSERPFLLSAADAVVLEAAPLEAAPTPP